MVYNYSTELEKIEEFLKKFFKTPQDDFFGSLKCARQKHFDFLFEPSRHLLSLGGKRWRPLFCVLCAKMLRQDESECELEYILAAACEFVHTASLIHDDIEDGADLRRGKIASHKEFGIDAALNSASALYFHAFSILRAAKIDSSLRLKAFEILSLQLSRLHLGQAMDIFWHKNPQIVPSKEEYGQMISLKTGSLAILAARFGALAAGADEADADFLAATAENLGIAFQIKDDVLNLTCGNKGKRRGDDIVEGKKSLPVILHCEKRPEDLPKIADFFHIAKREGEKSQAIDECIDLLNSSGAVAQAEKIAAETLQNSCENLAKKFGEKSGRIIALFEGL